jgi:hypothetical protein
VGFWTPQYLQDKLEHLLAAGASNLIICIDEKRNCSDSDLPTTSPVIRYRNRVDVGAVLAAVESMPASWESDRCRTSVADTPGEEAMRSAAHPTPSKPIEARETMPLRDLFLDFAGRKDPADPIHARLDALQPGAELGFTTRGRLMEIVDGTGAVLAVLSSRGYEKWSGRREHILSIRLIDKQRRDESQSSPTYRCHLRCERWWVPVVELRWDTSTASTPATWRRSSPPT